MRRPDRSCEKAQPSQRRKAVGATTTTEARRGPAQSVGSDEGKGVQPEGEPRQIRLAAPREVSMARYWGPLAAAALATASFANATDGELLFDDAYAIVQNPDVLATSPWWGLWAHDFWGFPLRSKTSHKSYRPLVTLSFRWQLWAVGGLSNARAARALHTGNVAIHAANSALLAFVGEEAFGLGRGEAAAAALLFAAHPVHVEAVAGVVGRAELLCCWCLLLACLAAVHVDAVAERQRVVVLAAAVVLLGAAALLCKETAALTLPFCAALDLLRAMVPLGLVASPPSGSACVAAAASQKASQQASLRRASVLRAAARSCRLLAATAALLACRVCLHGGPAAAPYMHPDANPGAFATERQPRILTLHYYLARHLELLFWPSPLCCDWSHSSIPLVEDFSDRRAWESLAIIYGPPSAIIAAVVVYLCADLRSSKEQLRLVIIQKFIARALSIGRPVVAGVLLIVMFLLPSSNLLFPVGFAVAERVLYLPSMGACTLAALLPSAAWARAGRLQAAWVARASRAVVASLCGAALVAGSRRCITRSADWHSADALYRAGVAANPLNEKLHDLLATRLHNSGRSKREAREAEEHARQAIAVSPTYWHAHATLGQLRISGDAAAAVTSYKRALVLAEAQGLGDMADAPKVRLNLAMLLQESAAAEAESHFRRVVSGHGIGSLQATALVVFGAFLESSGPGGRRSPRLLEAAHNYREALSSPGSSSCADAVHLRLGHLLVKQLRQAEAEIALAAAGNAKASARTRTQKQAAVVPPWPRLDDSTRTPHSRMGGCPMSPSRGAAVERGGRQTAGRGSSCLQPPNKPHNNLGFVVLGAAGDSGEAASSPTWRSKLERLAGRLGCMPVHVAASFGPAWRSAHAWLMALFRRLFVPTTAAATGAVSLVSHRLARPALPPAPSAEEALWHLRAGLALRPTPESVTLDPGGQRRLQALPLVAARLAVARRFQEALPYLRAGSQAVSAPGQTGRAAIAVALVRLGRLRLDANDVATAYEVLTAAALLDETVDAHLGLATALSRAGDAAAETRHRLRAEALRAKREGRQEGHSHTR